MKRIMLKLNVLAFFFIGLMAMDLPFQINHQDNFSSLYAFGLRPGNQRPGNNVTEPSLLILLAGGLTGIGVYRYIKNKQKKRDEM